MILQLDPDDYEAEQAIRAALDKRSKNDIAKALRKQLNTLIPVGATDAEVISAAHRVVGTSGGVRDALRRALADSADLGVNVAVDQFENIGFGFDWTMSNQHAVEWANNYSSTLLNEINTTTGKRVGTAVSEWIDNGEPLSKLRQELTPIFGEKRAKMIADTEVTRAYAEGNRIAYRDSGVVEQIEWRTSEDERVCPVCGALNGKHGPLEGGVEGVFPPAHPNCRCWIVPVVETQREEEQAQEIAQPIPQPELKDNEQFIPAKTKEEVRERISPYTKKYDLGDLPLERQNSILRGVEGVLKDSGIKLEELGYQKGRHRSLGRAVRRDETVRVEIQKAFARNPEKQVLKNIDLFEKQKVRNIERLEKAVADPNRRYILEQNTNALEHWKQVNRWSMIDVADDPLEAAIRHECHHVIDFSYSYSHNGNSLSRQLADAVTKEWASVSEYGSSKSAELWAEVGTAVDMNIDISPNILSAYRKILSNAK